MNLLEITNRSPLHAADIPLAISGVGGQNHRMKSTLAWPVTGPLERSTLNYTQEAERLLQSTAGLLKDKNKARAVLMALGMHTK